MNSLFARKYQIPVFSTFANALPIVAESFPASELNDASVGGKAVVLKTFHPLSSTFFDLPARGVPTSD
uniref:Secreted protein n=1 Tax=Panagrellus redivivus TaxID=6233 RepID=A0A7E4UVG0_PANRE